MELDIKPDTVGGALANGEEKKRKRHENETEEERAERKRKKKEKKEKKEKRKLKEESKAIKDDGATKIVKNDPNEEGD